MRARYSRTSCVSSGVVMSFGMRTHLVRTHRHWHLGQRRRRSNTGIGPCTAVNRHG
ncbi:hypothetical protein PIS_106 [Saccharomonospora phage PIS 136]|nr:hypothetical protein PIS_106 [Saccharomonospora phage PIS 136]